MTPRLTGAFIALCIVVAVAVTSMRLISFSFQDQTIPESRQAAAQTQSQPDDPSNVLAVLMQMREERQPAESRPQADLERQRRESEQRQAELRQKQDEERKLAEARRQSEQQSQAQQREAEQARRQAEQQRLAREAQLREQELARKLEEQRKLTEAWLKEEQEREQRKVEQLQADLKRTRPEDRKLTDVRPQADKQQRVAAETAREPVQKSESKPGHKSESKIAAAPAQPEGKTMPVQAQAPAPAKTASAAAEPSEQRQAAMVYASVKRHKKPACALLADVDDMLGLGPTRKRTRVADRDGGQRKIAAQPVVRAANLDARQMSQ